MIGIIDYGAGNLFSVKNALDYLGVENCVTGDREEIEKADGLILPGVGAFPDAMEMLEKKGLAEVISREALKKPLLGICLGMQLLFEKSCEFKETKGLGLIPGQVIQIEAKGLKIPHMGWNSLELVGNGRLFQGLPEEPYVYFVHSYYLKASDPEIVTAVTRYGAEIHASVEKNNVFACQFHPEKSSATGLKILKNFAQI